MKDKIKVSAYSRRNHETAIIYVRGDREAAQKLFCTLYALEKDYEVIYTTKHIEDVNLCDVLLVANETRIGRDKYECDKIINNLKEKGIRVEVAINDESAKRYIDILTREVKQNVEKKMNK